MKIKFKDQQIEVPEGANFEFIGGDLVISPKELEFKDGDIVTVSDRGNFYDVIVIIKEVNLEIVNGIKIYIGITDSNRILTEKISSKWDCIRFSTNEEKQVLFDALEKDGKRWNPETKQIEDVLNVGDICIFWDNNKYEAIISILTGLDRRLFIAGNGESFLNAIKFESIEHYKSLTKK